MRPNATSGFGGGGVISCARSANYGVDSSNPFLRSEAPALGVGGGRGVFLVFAVRGRNCPPRDGPATKTAVNHRGVTLIKGQWRHTTIQRAVLVATITIITTPTLTTMATIITKSYSFLVLLPVHDTIYLNDDYTPFETSTTLVPSGRPTRDGWPTTVQIVFLLFDRQHATQQF